MFEEMELLKSEIQLHIEMTQTQHLEMAEAVAELQKQATHELVEIPQDQTLALQSEEMAFGSQLLNNEMTETLLVRMAEVVLERTKQALHAQPMLQTIQRPHVMRYVGMESDTLHSVMMEILHLETAEVLHVLLNLGTPASEDPLIHQIYA